MQLEITENSNLNNKEESWTSGLTDPLTQNRHEGHVSPLCVCVCSSVCACALCVVCSVCVCPLYVCGFVCGSVCVTLSGFQSSKMALS